LQLLLTAEVENNNDSPADMFLQLQCRLDLIFFLKICQVLTNNAAALDTHCKLVAVLSSIFYWFKYQWTVQYHWSVHTVLLCTFQMNIV
jgi:hypothetical protein